MSLVINSYNYPYQGWKSVPSTGSQTLIRVSGSGQIQYSVFGTNGLYKSIDYGKTWSYVNFINYYISSLEISDSGQIIYFTYTTATDNYLFKSSDFGNTWQLLNIAPQPQRYYLIINSSNDGDEIMLYAVKGYGTGPIAKAPIIVRSIDGGNTFTYTDPTSLPVSIDLWSVKSSRDFSVIYAKRFNGIPGSTSGESELYKSIDYGVNWVSCFNNPDLIARDQISTSRNGEIVFIHENAPQTVGSIIIGTAISTDFGQTWNPYSLSNSSLAAFSDDNKNITLIRTFDGSQSYSQVFTNFGYRINVPVTSDISMSLDGRFQSLATDNLVWINNNFGF
jgi:hypothetical protein